MNIKNILAILMAIVIVTGCSVPVDNEINNTTETTETDVSLVESTAYTVPEENQEAIKHINNAYNLMMTDSVHEAFEEAMCGFDEALYPDDTVLPFVLSELLGAYDTGNTYRATDSFNTECDIDENTVILSYPGSRYLAIKNADNVIVIDVETKLIKYDIQINDGDNKCAFVNENLFCYCGPDGEGMYGDYGIDLSNDSIMQFGLGYEPDSIILADGEGKGAFLYYNSGSVLHLTPTAENLFEMETQDYTELENCEPENILFENDTVIVSRNNAICGVDLTEQSRAFNIEAEKAVLTDAASIDGKFLINLCFEDNDGNISDTQTVIIDGGSIVTVSSDGMPTSEIIVMPNEKDKFYLRGSTCILEVDVETASVSNDLVFDNPILSVFTEDGNVNAILADGSVCMGYRCVGLTSNYVCRTEDIVCASVFNNGFIMVPRDENRIIVYSAIDSQMSVTVTATDSDSMRPQNMENDGEFYLFADFKLAFNDEGKAVIYSGSDAVGEFDVVDGVIPTSSVSYGGYNVLYASGNQTGYILKGTQLVGIAHNFVALDPSDLSVYIGTDVMHKIFIMGSEELFALYEN